MTITVVLSDALARVNAAPNSAGLATVTASAPIRPRMCFKIHGKRFLAPSGNPRSDC